MICAANPSTSLPGGSCPPSSYRYCCICFSGFGRAPIPCPPPAGRSSEHIVPAGVPFGPRGDRPGRSSRQIPPRTKRALAPESVDLGRTRRQPSKADGRRQGENPLRQKSTSLVLSEKPTASSPTLEETTQMAKRSGAQSILEDTRSLQAALLSEKPDVAGQPSGKTLDPQALTGRAAAKTGELRGADVPGFSNPGRSSRSNRPVEFGAAPILMRDGTCYSTMTRRTCAPRRSPALRSSARWIRRNPQAAFVIEGHTDSFGSDTYNLDLSRRRAESVKAWLVTMMKIPAGRIDARGYGKSRLIAPASGTIEEQQINRRVEIVIRTN